MFKRKNVYAKANEKFVKTVVLYANGSNKLFFDEGAKTDAVKSTELKDLFLKGATIVKNEVYYKGICFKTNGIVGTDGSAPVTFTAV